MRVKLRLPDGSFREIPEWAKCYCVTRHTPHYINPMPFVIADGTELWLCPNTHHQATTLMKLYKKFNGPPDLKTNNKFNFFVRQLLTLHWRLHMENGREIPLDASDEDLAKAAFDRLKEMDI